MISKIVVGNRKVSEYSKELTVSKFNEPNILSLIFSDGLIDFDLKSNMYMSTNDVSVEANDIDIEANSSNEDLVSDKTITCTNLNLTATEAATISSTTLNLLGEKIIQLSASEQISFESPAVILGALFKQASEELELSADYVMTKNKFDKWWNTTMKQFFELITNFINKYNQHTHPNNNTPPTPSGLVTGSGSTISEAEDSSKMLKSITTKAI